eukprot:388363-Heterocapsa_arctica.AAC.1
MSSARRLVMELCTRALAGHYSLRRHVPAAQQGRHRVGQYACRFCVRREECAGGGCDEGAHALCVRVTTVVV